MALGTPSLTMLSNEQKFNGENLLKWKINMLQLLGSKGLTGYIDGNITKPTQLSVTTTTPDPTPIYSTKLNVDEWTFHDQLACGHITLNCTDISGLGMITTGMAKEAWDSIQAEWGKSTNMQRSHAQEALNWTTYMEGSDIQEHIKLLRTCKAGIDNWSTSTMPDETWKGIIIQSIPPTVKWLPVIPSLYAMTSPADIFSTLIAHGMILERGMQGKPTSGSSTTALAARPEACTNPNCKAKKQSTHTFANCYWPGGGKEGQFPPNFSQRTRANIISSNHNAMEHFVLSARVTDIPRNLGIVLDDDWDKYTPPVALISKSFHAFNNGKIPIFMDSGTSDTMFVSRDAFDIYKVMQPRSGDSAKAIDGEFEIVGEGTVNKRYLVDGKEKQITYTRAIHTPTLNTNLISVSAFDRAGMTVTFGDG